MTAVFVPVAEQAAIDAAAAEAVAGSVAAVAAVGAPAAIIAAGAATTYTLVNWKPWSNFWEGVGGRVTDWFHAGTSFLFGGAAISIATVHGMIQLALHGANAYTRELFVQGSVAAHAMIHVLAHGLDAVRIDVHRLVGSVVSVAHDGLVHLLQAEAFAQSYTDAHLRKLLQDVVSLDLRTASNVERWVQTDIASPILREIGRVDAKVGAIAGSLGALIEAEATRIVNARTAALAAALAALGVSVASIAAEIEQCVQPMCESFGPKTDLGRLFKLLSVLKWTAILAALETTNVHDLERLAATVAGTEGRIGEWVASHVLDELVGEHK